MIYEKPQRLKLLLLAPYLDAGDVGEAYIAYQWTKALSAFTDITLLTMTRPRTEGLTALDGVRIISCKEPAFYRNFERLNAMAKLSYRHYERWATSTIETLIKDGNHFDVAHQLTPFAMRHASPLRHFQIPYILGPYAGGLKTPIGFKAELEHDAVFMKLRALDPLIRHGSKAIKDSWNKASRILGVAPYVMDRLPLNTHNRFAMISELGVWKLAKQRKSNPKNDVIKLLHVGRGIRTKGLADAIKALLFIPKTLKFHLNVAGQGSEIERCKKLATDYGLSQHITFWGQIPRAQVDRLYAQSDIFLFPSFREPSGSVIYEAMSHSLPLVVADYGGPQAVVDDKCGIRVAVSEPDQFARDLASAIKKLANAPYKREAMGQAARQKMIDIALWSNKAQWMIKQYQAVVAECQTPASQKAS